jgi:hypothetical protein
MSPSDVKTLLQLVVQPLSRTVRSALKSWSRTARLISVITSVFIDLAIYHRFH